MDSLLAAARLGDPVAHTASKGWMLAGLIGGALLGAAVVALTGGTALIALAAVAAGAAAGGGIGEVLGTMSWAPRHVTGSLISGSPNVFINSRSAIRAHISNGLCSDHSGAPQVVAQGSSTVFINGQPASRKEDMLACSAVISDGSPNVFIGGARQTTDDISPEVPAWMNWAMLGVGIAAAVVLAGPVVGLIGAAGGFAGGELGSAVGGAVFGEGSDGQKWSMLGGSLVGGGLAGKGAGMLEAPKEPVPIALLKSPKEPVAAPVSRFDYTVDKVPADLEPNAAGVYGYMPKEGTEFHQSKWGVDWTDPEATAGATAKRIDYHEGMEQKEAWIADQRSAGVPDEEIAQQITNSRNADRLSYYAEEQLPGVYARNLAKYGDKMGPSYDYLIESGKTPQQIIESATRTNPTMDILTGIAKVK